MNLLYDIMNKTPIPAGDDYGVMERRRQTSDWIVGRSVIYDSTHEQEILVSTVFLFLNHSFGGTPVLFETMIFGSDNESVSDFQRRYYTWEEAEEGHKAAVEAILAFFPGAAVTYEADDATVDRITERNRQRINASIQDTQKLLESGEDE